MKWLPYILLGAVIFGTALSFGRLQLRRSRNRPIKAWVQNQPITYSTNAFVRERRLRAWVNWSSRLGGGPQMIVRTRGIEVSAPRGMVLESRALFLNAEKASMWVDRVGWAGTPFGRKDCIRLCGHDEGSRVDLALTPDTGIAETWQALLTAGAQQKPPRS
jgi:hypothetical protein